MKKIILPLISLILVASLLFAGCEPATAPKTSPSEPIELKAVSAAPLVNATAQQFIHWVDLVNDRAAGELHIDLLGSTEVIPYFDMPQALVSGTVDIISGWAAFYQELVPVARTPHLSKLTPWEEREPGGYFDLMQEGHKKVGIYYLGRTCSNMPFYMYPMKPIKTPQELKGMKFRTAYVYDSFLKALGIVGVPMPNADAYSSLQQGVIDGAVNSLPENIDFKWYEVSHYAIDTSFWGPNGVALVNLTVWNKIPEHLQEIMIDAQKETERWGWDYYGDLALQWHQELTDNGVTWIEFSPEDATWFTNLAYESAWQVATNAVGEETAAVLKKALGG